MNISVSFCLHFYVVIEQGLVHKLLDKTMFDNKGYAGAVLMNLSKAFDTINYELLTAKLHAYGFSKEALKLSYLKHRKQRVKVNTTFSS